MRSRITKTITDRKKKNKNYNTYDQLNYFPFLPFNMKMKTINEINTQNPKQTIHARS